MTPTNATDSPHDVATKRQFPIRRALTRGVGANHAVPYVPLLIFCVIGPPILSNSFMHVTVMLNSGQAARVPELAFAAMVFLSRWAFLGLLIGAAFVLPGITGGAAGRYASLLASQVGYQQPFWVYAREGYGRTFAIMICFGSVLLVGSVIESSLLPSTGPRPLAVTYLRSLSIGVLRTAVTTWMWLSVAVVALDDRGAIGAIRHAGYFVRSQPKAYAMLIVAIALGHVLSHAIVQILEVFRVANAPLAYVFTTITHGAWLAYLMALTIAWAVAFVSDWALIRQEGVGPMT